MLCLRLDIYSTRAIFVERFIKKMSFIDINVVDAFTSEVFSGNPAAVCCLEKVIFFRIYI